MKADNVLILAAGLGTRMGELGKVLPKPLWPHKGSTLLARQIQFARSLTDGQIWVNTHHCADQIDDYLQRFFPSVRTVYEENILGSGGAIHNLVNKHKLSGRLITINSDVLYEIGSIDKRNFLSPLKDVHARLVAMKVDNVGDYNELVCKNESLYSIAKPQKNPYKTYSGIGLVNIENLKYVDGVSSFFETVADFKNQKVTVVDMSDLRTVDYGTLTHYYESSNKIEKSELGVLKLSKESGSVVTEYLKY